MGASIFTAQKTRLCIPFSVPRRIGGLVITAIAFSFWGGCAQPGGVHHPVRSLSEIRYERVIIQKWDLSCGAAALATLLTFDHCDPVSEREVAQSMLRRKDPLKIRVQGGFSLLDMQEYAERRGYEASGYGELTLDQLRQLAPAIVPVRIHGYDHFVIVREVGTREVNFADPAFGNRSKQVSDFDQIWEQKVAFVISRRCP